MCMELFYPDLHEDLKKTRVVLGTVFFYGTRSDGIAK